MSKLGNVQRVMPQPISIEEAYKVCRTITFRYAKTFSLASYFIPRSKRNACFAVYAFCRYVDDLVDVAMEQGNVTRQDAVNLVAQWKVDLDNIYNRVDIPRESGTQNADDRTKILIAWEDTLNTFHIPRHLPHELIEGVLMDTSVTRFDTFDELREYCYKVASVVGLMTSEIFGYSSPDALARAIDLGIAMQLTNIIRDVREDAVRGRIYLPKEDMQRFGVNESDILEHHFTPNIKELIRCYVGLADNYYDSAEPGIQLLHADSRLTVLLMSNNYRRILRAVESMDYNVFTKRASISLFRKLTAIPEAFMMSRRMEMFRRTEMQRQ